MDAADILLTEIQQLVRDRGIDPLKDTSTLEGLVAEASADYLQRADAGLVPALVDPDAARARALDSLAGLGPLQAYLDDEGIEEIWINAPGRVFVARSGRPELTTTILEAEDLRVLVERMLRVSGRRLDLSSPFVDSQLPGGERLHVVIPPITSQNWAVNIRKHSSRASRTADLVRMGSLPAGAAAFLDASVQAGLNILVSGATQAGKTTLVRALAGAIPAAQRVISCEEVFELALRNRDCVAMQTRPANLEGVGEITLRRLVKEALRMRPDRLIIGEVREAEALDLLIAMNSGLPSMCTIHANSAREAIVKICTLPLLAVRTSPATSWSPRWPPRSTWSSTSTSTPADGAPSGRSPPCPAGWRTGSSSWPTSTTATSPAPSCAAPDSPTDRSATPASGTTWPLSWPTPTCPAGRDRGSGTDGRHRRAAGGPGPVVAVDGLHQ